MIRRIVPDVIGDQVLQKVTPRDTVRQAARLMREKKSPPSLSWKATVWWALSPNAT